MTMKYLTLIVAAVCLALFLPSCSRETKSLKEELRVMKEENSFLKAENIALKKEVEELYRKLEERDKAKAAPETQAKPEVLKKDAKPGGPERPEKPDAERRKPETERPR